MSDYEKAYKNQNFLNSPAARHIRILCEYEEPRQRFREHKVRDTIVMFGSARIQPRSRAELHLEQARHELGKASASERATFERQVQLAQKKLDLSRYYEDTRELARRLTEWSMARQRHYFVCSGGGPGIMEAANRGAKDVPDGRSVALGISLPFEEKLNPFATPELGFEFHYFFMRKYWFMYLAKALVAFPGGFGTLDELFETLTLRQTGKVKKPIPTVLYGTPFWSEVMNLEALVEWGTISERDLLLMHRTDDVDDAFDYLTRTLVANEQEDVMSVPPRVERSD